METRPMLELKAYALGVPAGFIALFASVQTLIYPADTWVPLAYIGGLVLAAIAATVKIMRVLNRVDELERRLRKLEGHDDESE